VVEQRPFKPRVEGPIPSALTKSIFYTMNEDTFHLGIKALIRNKSGKILLMKVNKTVLKGYNGETYWDIPGGRIQKDGTVEDTLRREIEEETGILDVSNIKPINMVLSKIRIPLDENNNVGLILSIYSCEIPEDAEIKLSDEHSEYGWFLPEEASKLLAFKYPEEFTSIVADLK
jgi:8-oxo-dGTP diphosphatase